MVKTLKKTILLMTIAALACNSCDDVRDWESTKKGVDLEITPKQLALDIPTSKALGLLQEGVAPDPTSTGYNLHILYGYGRTVTIDIKPETDDWGIVFPRITHTFDEEESGITWPGESDKGYIFIPVQEQEIEGRPHAGPVRNGVMPLVVSVLDQDGETLITQKTSIQVYDKNKVLKTIGELNDLWKLNIGDAEFYVPAEGENPAQNEKNKLIIYSQLRNANGTIAVVDDFEGRGIPVTRIKKGTVITSSNLDFKQYVTTDNVTGVFWQSIYNPYSDPATGIVWGQESARAQILDYETGEEIQESADFSVYLCGSNGKSSTNAINNNGARWDNVVLAGTGDERIIDMKKSGSNWPFGTVKPCTFGVNGTYILQWELLNKRPGNNLSVPLTVIGKMRMIVQVVDEL